MALKTHIVIYSFLINIVCINLNCMDYKASHQKWVRSYEKFQQREDRKPLIVILTSNGGGGHMSATKAIDSYLKDHYRIEYKYILEDSLPLQRIGINGEQRYNDLVKYTSNGFILNLIFSIGAQYFKFFARSIEDNLKRYLLEKNPQLVISVVPMINASVFNVTAELNIPFLLSPTDIDFSTFLQGFNGSLHPCFKFNVLFPDEVIARRLEDAKINERSLVRLGFPLREDFYAVKDLPALKQEYNIDPSKPVLLLMMGSQGSQIIIDYVRQLTQVDLPFHLIICIGRNEGLIPEIHKVAQFKTGSTYAIQGMTDRMSDLMAMSDLFITKSGTASVCEAIQMRLPMLLDATVPLIRWEQYNHDFVDRCDFGRSISDPEMIAPITASLLENDTYKKLRLNFEKFNQVYTIERVQDLVQAMVVRSLMPAKL